MCYRSTNWPKHVQTVHEFTFSVLQGRIRHQTSEIRSLKQIVLHIAYGFRVVCYQAIDFILSISFLL